MTTWTDLFAGAGGSSSGIASVPGNEVKIAANHWRLAVDVHQQNHQQTDHACVDLHQEDPRNFPRTEFAWMSPECKQWSIANSKATALSREMGGDPTLFDDVPDELISAEELERDRSRLLMFDVLRFIEYHRYRVVVVENVVDIATRPKYAKAWAAWRRGLRKLGYAFRVVSMNSMHAQAFGPPARQSRDRLYIVAWPEKEKGPDIDAIQRPRAYCRRCDRIVESRQAWKPDRTVGRYLAQYVFACTQCGRPAAPGWLPAHTAIDRSIEGRLIGEKPIRKFVDKLTGEVSYGPLAPKTMGRIRSALRKYAHEFVPALIPTEGRDGKEARPVTHPFRTQTTRNELGILTMLRGTNAPKLTSDPLDTMAASGNHHGLLIPYYSSAESGKPTSQPIGTLTTRDRYALIMRHNSSRGDGSEMATPAYEQMRTITTRGHQSVLEPATIEPEDCTFRMLEPHEIAAGMSFPLDYQWEGTKRQRVKLCGNAVTPPAARDLAHAVAGVMS